MSYRLGYTFIAEDSIVLLNLRAYIVHIFYKICLSEHGEEIKGGRFWVAYQQTLAI